MTLPALDLFDVDELSEPAAQAVRRIAILGFHALWQGGHAEARGARRRRRGAGGGYRASARLWPR